MTPTPRPTDGVDVYFEMPGDGSEHANFLRAKMDLEERRMRQINEVVASLSPLLSPHPPYDMCLLTPVFQHPSPRDSQTGDARASVVLTILDVRCLSHLSAENAPGNVEGKILGCREITHDLPDAPGVYSGHLVPGVGVKKNLWPQVPEPLATPL